MDRLAPNLYCHHLSWHAGIRLIEINRILQLIAEILSSLILVPSLTDIAR